MKSKKNKIIIVMLIAILFMATGYAILSTRLNIKGMSSLTDTWGVRITNITSTPTGRAYNISEPSYTDTSMTFEVGVKEPGDKMTFEVTVENFGSLDAILEDIDAGFSGSAIIKYSISGIQKQSRLAAGESLTFTVTTEFDINATTIPVTPISELTIGLIYIQDDGQTLTPSNPNIDDDTPYPTITEQIMASNTAYADNVASKYVTSSTGIDFTKASSDTNGKGLYYTSTNTEDNQTVYYFRGDVTNNYVKLGTVQENETFVCATGYCSTENRIYDSVESCFENSGGMPAEYCYEVSLKKGEDILWRIVRVNEDGSIRLVTDDVVGFSSFNDMYNDNAFVGYMYGTSGSSTYDDTHANVSNSAIRNFLDSWYLTHLNAYSDIMSYDSGFCNDRSKSDKAGQWSGIYPFPDTTLGYGKNTTIYSPAARLDRDYSSNIARKPIFKCNQTNDLFTHVNSTKGNKTLSSPIGLLTFDEVTYAGQIAYSGNYSLNYYLYNKFSWWTMSPEAMISESSNSVDAYVNNYAIYEEGPGGGLGIKVDGFHGVRPVINIKGDIKITSGDGSSTSPYELKID